MCARGKIYGKRTNELKKAILLLKIQKLRKFLVSFSLVYFSFCKNPWRHGYKNKCLKIALEWNTETFIFSFSGWNRNRKYQRNMTWNYCCNLIVIFCVNIIIILCSLANHFCNLLSTKTNLLSLRVWFEFPINIIYTIFILLFPFYAWLIDIPFQFAWDL